jgi:hypothetical protein
VTRGGAAARLAALAATAVALVATSPVPLECPPESGLVPGPVTLAVDSTCGPPGTIVLVQEQPGSCYLRVEGGAAVGLGDSAEVDWAERIVELSSADFQHRCAGIDAGAGSFRLRCYVDTNGGCGHDTVPYCEGTMRIVAP